MRLIRRTGAKSAAIAVDGEENCRTAPQSASVRTFDVDEWPSRSARDRLGVIQRAHP